MTTYEICGTCSILAIDGKINIRIIPATGYIAADNKVAIFYSQNDPPNESKLVPISEKSGIKFIERPLKKKDNNLIAILNTAAGSSKKVQLFLDDNLQITGCLFPAP
jgi:hypothetical protein